MNYFQNKNILITGAAGGFGGEFIRQLLPFGARLVLTDIDINVLQKKADEISSTLKNNTGEIIATGSFDLSRPENCYELYKFCREKAGHMDIIINNAGILTYGYFHEHPETALIKMIEVNVTAPILISRLFLNDMIANRSGHIVFLSSLASVIPTAFETSYTASKCAIRGLGMALSREVSPLGISITNIYPTFADTDMLKVKSFGSMKVKKLSSFLIDKPESVVFHSIQGIAKKKLHVYPGFQAKFFSKLVKLKTVVNSLPMERKN